MILTCPDCATRYFVDDAKLGAEGRTVRCASCGAKWKAEPEVALELVASAEEGAVAREVKAPEPAPEPKAEPLPKLFRAKQVEKKTMRRAMVHGVVWAAMLAIVAGLLGAAALFRGDIVRAIPRTAGAYAMVGLPVNPTGLVFEKITARPSLEDGHSALVVAGQVRNVEHRAVAIPAIRIHILDAHGKPVAEKVTATEDPHLKPGESRHFVVSLRDPPASARDVELAFLIGGGASHAPAAHPADHAAPPVPVLRGPAPSEAHHEETVAPAPEAAHAEEHHAPAPPTAPQPATAPAAEHH